MSLPLHTPARVSTYLEAHHDIVLDLVQGLSGHISLCVRNDEDQAVTLIIPGFSLYKSFDFMVALAQGIFQFTELGTGSSISLDKSKLADTETLQPTHLIISPGTTTKLTLLFRGSRRICHIGLRAWESYVLGFNDLPEGLSAKLVPSKKRPASKRKERFPRQPYTRMTKKILHYLILLSTQSRSK